jgi:molybdenum cofactor biosynthesis enzyme MoaA
VKIQTFSIVIGTKACNAKCPFCVSRMTGFDPVIGKVAEINEINFEKACRLAEIGGTTTVLMTGKGEPTLYPREITAYLSLLQRRKNAFPFIEIQTNAIELGRIARKEPSKVPGFSSSDVTQWREMGLNTIAISNVGQVHDWNKRIYGEAYGDLGPTIDFLHETGFTVRLCTMLQKECVDDAVKLQDLVTFCRKHGVDQLTVRPIRKPKATKDGGATDFVTQYGLDEAEEHAISDFIHEKGTLLARLMHGAAIFDLDGQNLCLSDCLTTNQESDHDDIRTLIFYSDGTLSYDWQYEGAKILGGTKSALVKLRHEPRPVKA